MFNEEQIFKALSDSTRRLLGLVFERAGRTLAELASRVARTRFGVMKRLRILEDAGLVISRREGRRKMHFVNAVQIRPIHNRWIDKFIERQVSALAGSKATLENKKWNPEKARRPKYTRSIFARLRRLFAVRSRRRSGRVNMGIVRAVYDLKPGSAYHSNSSAQMRSMGLPGVIIDSEVVEVSQPRKLVHTLRFLFSEQNEAEGFTRIAWEIEPRRAGFCRVTVNHELQGAPPRAPRRRASSTVEAVANGLGSLAT